MSIPDTIWSSFVGRVYRKQCLDIAILIVCKRSLRIEADARLAAYSIVLSTIEIGTDNPGVAKKIIGFLEELEISTAPLENVKNE